jgi:DNA-binding NarL/FixJ family response regulator
LPRALLGTDTRTDDLESDLALTRRETEAPALIGPWLFNKNIGDELCLSVATVTHHIHQVLEKLPLTRRRRCARCGMRRGLPSGGV